MSQDRKAFRRDLWALIRPYWVGEERWAARGLLTVIVALNLGMVYLNVLFNSWYRVFYNALEGRDFPLFKQQLLIFSGLATAYITAAIIRYTVNQYLQLRWRRWLTGRFLDEWLDRATYYRLQTGDGATDNPDQRIADDVHQFVASTLSLSLGAFSSAVTLLSFLSILWGLSGTIHLALGGFDLAIPGDMLWFALIYAVIGSWLTHLVGRPLVGLNMERQRREADFRFALVRLRENAEGVALYRGEAEERGQFTRLFARIIDNWRELITRQKRLIGFTTGYSQIAVVVPFVIGAPRYFAGTIDLGQLMQTNSAFGQVQDALSWFINAYGDLAEWSATVRRLIGFRTAMDAVHSPAIAAEAAIDRRDAGSELATEGLTLTLPGGRVLLEAASMVVHPGERVMITGPSGAGKSTLFRALAGLWRRGSGRVTLPAQGRRLFLPQKPYLPLGSLAEVVAYPGDSSQIGPEAIGRALTDCGLPGLVPRLAEIANWSQMLSPGEQQRLAIARALLLRPDWLFLDEATSALDGEGEAALYQLLRDRLAGAAIVSIGHRTSLLAFHNRMLTLVAGDQGWHVESRDLAAAQ